MKVGGLNGIGPIQTYRVQAGKQVRERGAAENVGAAGADVVELSPAARELQEYRAHLRELPEVREELVASLRERLARGEFRVDVEKIAEGIAAEYGTGREGTAIPKVDEG
ncbi:MAG: flagellar biosynthesis anti-sigma factor FlgM [Firmicutes bacterium]|nr:flagellar biosynthesis anti-sigma factor FlgM [Bacillota bacterium]